MDLCYWNVLFVVAWLVCVVFFLRWGFILFLGMAWVCCVGWFCGWFGFWWAVLVVDIGLAARVKLDVVLMLFCFAIIVV